jgi:hypothetical protein
MTGLTDLKTLEKQAFRRFYEDGIFDIFLGSMLGTMAIGASVADRWGNETSGMLVMLGIAVVAVVSLMIVRRHLLSTRLGEFKPGPARKRRISATRLALLGSAVLGLVLFGITWAGDVSIVSLEVLMPLIWFLNAVVVMGAMAYFLDVPRFYLYGFLFGLVMPVMVWPDVLWNYRTPRWISFGVPAAIIVAIGLIKLVRFLRDYPVRSIMEPSDV